MESLSPDVKDQDPANATGQIPRLLTRNFNVDHSLLLRFCVLLVSFPVGDLDDHSQVGLRAYVLENLGIVIM
jgi:hypothetical protein